MQPPGAGGADGEQKDNKFFAIVHCILFYVLV